MTSFGPEVDAFVALLYEVVLQGSPWQSVLDALAALARADYGTLVDVDSLSATIWFQALTGSEIHARRSSLPHLAPLQPGDRPPALRWFSHRDKSDAGENLTASVGIEGPRAVSLTLGRQRAAGRFSVQRKRLLDQVLPHLDRAAWLGRRMTAFARGAEIGKSLIGAVREPLASVSPRGELWLANEAFEALLLREPALSLRAGCLVIADPRTHAAFDEALRVASRQAASPHPLMRGSIASLHVARGVRPPLALSVLPMVRVDAAPWLERHGALVRIVDPSATPGPERLMEAFGLTPAEARTVCALAEGGARAELAQRLGISLNTVRSHLVAVFHKTGVKSSGELVQRIRGLDP